MNKKYSEEMKEETSLYILESGKSITNAIAKRGTLLKQRESIRMISKD
ncbi:MAG: hypothetical protein K6G85_10925 [Eubacterium sp.]|nr:hypothetical protein [Eubacterium sp.]